MLLILFITLSIPAFTITLQGLKLEILSKMSHMLFNKRYIYIYLADDSFIDKKIKTDKLNLIFVTNCSHADLIISGSLKSIPKKCIKKPIFATNYPFYKNRHTIGALFWQKGRPVLILKKKALKIRHIRIKKALEKYLQ